MNEIKSLADELRESMRGNGKGKKKTTAGLNPDLEKLLGQIQEHPLEGNEKVLVRLNDKSLFMMRQLKTLRGIDLNRFISFCLDRYFSDNPELGTYIKDSLNKKL